MSMDPSGTDVEPVDGWPVTKPGYQSSEWWLALGTSVATIVVAIVALFGKHLNGDTLTPIIGAVAVLGPVIASAFYSHSRGQVKAAAHAASASRVSMLQMASPLLEAPGVMSSTAAPATGDSTLSH